MIAPLSLFSEVWSFSVPTLLGFFDLQAVSRIPVIASGFAAVWMSSHVAGLPLPGVYRFQRRAFGGSPRFLDRVQLSGFSVSDTGQSYALDTAAVVGVSKCKVSFWARLPGEIYRLA
jgi:hypothetical protein